MPYLAVDDDAALTRVREVRLLLDWLRGQAALLAAERDQAILELTSGGMSYEAVAKESGLTRGRVGQIVLSHRP